jgi:hypothetical protein
VISTTAADGEYRHGRVTMMLRSDKDDYRFERGFTGNLDESPGWSLRPQILARNAATDEPKPMNLAHYRLHPGFVGPAV